MARHYFLSQRSVHMNHYEVSLVFLLLVQQ